MFFMRLRKGARWAFVVLIIVFAFTFLFAGVGSGGSGGDVIQQLLGMRGGSDPITTAEKDVAKHPHRASALLTLAQAYDAKQRRGDAINAYKKYLTLKPKDPSALLQLGRLQQDVTTARWARYSNLQAEMSVTSGPLSSDPVQTLVGADQLLAAYSNTLTAKVSSAYGSYITAATAWEDTYKVYAKSVPIANTLQRAEIELELGQAASNATDYATAIKSYETYLKLTPKSPLAPQVKKALAALRKINSNGSTSSTTG